MARQRAELSAAYWLQRLTSLLMDQAVNVLQLKTEGEAAQTATERTHWSGSCAESA